MNTPTDQAKQHVEQARNKLAGVEREADEIATAYPHGLPESLATNLADRWQVSIAAAQAHATLAVAERLAAVVGHLEVLAAPQPDRADAAVLEWALGAARELHGTHTRYDRDADRYETTIAECRRDECVEACRVLDITGEWS